ncbi:MAG: extensin family protein [Deltaproteobacteria bacterium]|nr:extensin family protein [Myxococcales bacterium]MDP3219609.1 extensin family protein [Deltaproteobacteria bacterium]
MSSLTRHRRRVSTALAATLAFSPMAACQVSPQGARPGGLSSLFSYAFGDRAARAEQQWQHLASEDAAACRAALRAAGVRFRAMPDRAAPDPRGCGIPHGVVVTRGPTGIVYDAPLVVDCSLARQLPAVEAAIQGAATAHLGQRITRVGTFGTFSCRPVRAGRGSLSEHAFGNAIDLARFAPRRGPAAVVVQHYQRDAEVPDTPRGRFLRELEQRLRGLDGVAHVIGPRQNDDHRDHFHIDRAWRWWRLGDEG